MIIVSAMAASILIHLDFLSILTRAKRNLIVEEVSKSYNKYKKYQNLATK